MTIQKAKAAYSRYFCKPEKKKFLVLEGDLVWVMENEEALTRRAVDHAYFFGFEMPKAITQSAIRTWL